MDTNDPRMVDIITIQNIDAGSFQVIYDGKLWAVIQPGEVRRMPRFLADHAVKHLIDQILNRMEKPTNNKALREQFAAKVVLDEEASMQPQPLNEQQRLEQDMKTLNTQTDLENVLNRHKTENSELASPGLPPVNIAPPAAVSEPVIPQMSPLEVSPPTHPSSPEGSGVPEFTPQSVVNTDIPVVEAVSENTNSDTPLEIPVEAVPVVATPEIPVDPNEPTRDSLYSWARTNMHMDIDEPKTRALLDATPVPQLIEDLQYAP